MSLSLCGHASEIDVMPDAANEAYLTELCEQIFTLEEELSKIEADSAAYWNTWKRLHQLKERYKQITGIYPQLPESGTGFRVGGDVK